MTPKKRTSRPNLYTCRSPPAPRSPHNGGARVGTRARLRGQSFTDNTPARTVTERTVRPASRHGRRNGLPSLPSARVPAQRLAVNSAAGRPVGQQTRRRRRSNAGRGQRTVDLALQPAGGRQHPAAVVAHVTGKDLQALQECGVRRSGVRHGVGEPMKPVPGPPGLPHRLVQVQAVGGPAASHPQSAAADRRRRVRRRRPTAPRSAAHQRSCRRELRRRARSAPKRIATPHPGPERPRCTLRPSDSLPTQPPQGL